MMPVIRSILKSSVGKKFLMAISGLVLYGFVVGHMLGNLQVFLGPEALNAYAAFLKSKPGLVWGVRLGLLLMLLVHVVTSIQLTRENRAARPVRYAKNKPTAASFASRTLLVSGLIIFSFVVYHLLHFTVGVTNPEYMQLRDSLGRHDVYRMTILGFSHPGVSFFYIFSMGLLCLHLSHGFSSIFQSLGFTGRRNGTALDRFSRGAALLLFLGNSSMPLAVLAGLVR